MQQASSWSLGDSFVFIDILDDGVPDGFNDLEFYGEWYPTLSFGRLAIGPWAADRSGTLR